MNNKDIIDLLEKQLISTERALELLRARGEFITIQVCRRLPRHMRWIILIEGQLEHYGNSLHETLIKALSNAVKQADHERSEPYDGWTSDY